jgi:hypothetical protein
VIVLWLPCLVLSYFALSCIILPGLVLSCLVVSCLAMPCLVLLCLVLSRLVLSRLVLSCPALPCPVVSFGVVFNRLMPSPVVRCLVLPRLVFSCLVLSLPRVVLSWTFTYACLLFFVVVSSCGVLSFTLVFHPGLPALASTIGIDYKLKHISLGDPPRNVTLQVGTVYDLALVFGL